MKAAIPIIEAQRVRALRQYWILDSEPEPAFDEIARLAVAFCGTLVGFVSLIDDKRQWFKAKVGLDQTETPRDLAFCAHSILLRDILEVSDATQDPRFCDNPSVTGAPNIRFYAGAPIITPEGYALGTVAVLDTISRKLTDQQRAVLRALASQAAIQLEWRRKSQEQQQGAEDTRCELELAAERLRLAVRAANVGAWDWNIATDEVYFSPEWKAQLGYKDEEIPHRFEEWQKRLHPEDAPRALDYLKAYLEKPSLNYCAEFRLRHKNGTYRWIRADASLVYDSNGKPTRLLGLHTDLTSHMETEEKLRRHEADLRKALAERNRTEAQKEQLERSLTLLFSNLPGLVYRCKKDENWTMEFVSNGALGLTGYSPEDLVEGRVQYGQLIHPEDRAYVAREVDSATRNQKPFQVSYRLSTAEGDEKWVWEQGSGVFDSDRKLIAIEGYICDITRSRRAEEAVRRERDFSSALLKSMPGVFYMIDAEGRFMRCNQRMEEVSQYSEEELSGMPVSHLFSGPDAELVKARIADVFVHGKSDVEAHLVSKSGKRTPFYFTGRLVVINGKQCLVGMGIDITERVGAEAAVRESREHFKLLVEHSSDLINILDCDGAVRFLSPSAQRILGYSPEELNGTNAIDRLHPEDQGRAKELLDRALAQPDVPLTGEFRCRHRDGTWRILETIGKALPQKRGERLVLLSSRDVTESRRISEQLRQSQKLEAIGQLSGGVAHDFNNILTVIQGQASLVESEPNLPAHVYESLREIVIASGRAANLTRQLLTFSRQQPIMLTNLDLSDSVARITTMLRRIVGEDVTVHIQLSPKPLIIHADAGMIDQILLNLAVNARDAMPQGGRLRIESSFCELDDKKSALIPGSRPGRFACLTVRDTGMGIAPEHLPRIFDPFFTTKEVGKGTGLGLSTVYGIVEQHNGWINVTSEPGQGATFALYFPSLSVQQIQSPRETQSAENLAGTETILVVEDEVAVRALVTKSLKRLGYDVLEAQSGLAALDVWEQNCDRIQLLLTDLVMPDGVSGIELAERLRAKMPGLKVVYTSGYSPEVAGKDITLTPAVNFLQKPYPPSKLAKTIRAALDRE